MESEVKAQEGEEKPSKSKIRIDTKDLVVRFGSIVALNSFSVGVPEGIVGLLGPNGAGKSTFIKAVLGLVNAEKGTISIDGLDPRKDITAVRDMVGYLPEHDCLITYLNAVELVSYMGQISGMSLKDAIQRTHEVLDFVGTGEERYRLISSYSTGMKQKVKLAQAIVHDPKILFLDEPTNGMDPQGREEMLELIKKIGASGKTILVSTHILQEVEKIGEHVIIINDGALIKEGSIKTLMIGEKNIFKIKIRGSQEGILGFGKALSEIAQVISTEDEEGQQTMVFKTTGDESKVFALASEKGIQIRDFGPATRTLEDIFIEAFKKGGA
ncbi:MAG: ABC transporter ATP-binding protein [Methanomassiliicoccales archaeon]|nr:MAG: ABC transporter ATP-binding protein [Methanomassiliicoccales archaeon]